MTALTWRKSSYSDGGVDNCVEVAGNHPHAVPVRDSKTPQGPTLTFPPDTWSTFITALKQAAPPA